MSLPPTDLTDPQCRTMEPVDTRIEILLVEDHPGDVRRFHEALRCAGQPYHMSVFPRRGAVLPFLRHEEPYASAPCPALIVLDLEAPIASGPRLL